MDFPFRTVDESSHFPSWHFVADHRLTAVGSGRGSPFHSLEGMRTIVVDCSAVQSEADFWAAYVETAKPDDSGYFGRNLDAFWDGLNGGPGWPGDCELRFTSTEHIQAFRGGQFVEALHDIASRSPFVKVTLE